jgi:hypothetical protein
VSAVEAAFVSLFTWLSDGMVTVPR